MSLLDWDQFLERVERNEALAFELAEDLLQSIDGRVAKLSDACLSMLPKSIEQTAHALRGLVAPYGGRELLAELKLIEENARHGAILYQSLPSEISLMVSGLKTELNIKLEKSRSESLTRSTGTEGL